MSGEDGGTIEASGDYMDAFSASWFDASVDTGNAQVGAAAYNGFDTDFSSNGYPHILETASNAIVSVAAYAGRLKTPR